MSLRPVVERRPGDANAAAEKDHPAADYFHKLGDAFTAAAAASGGVDEHDLMFAGSVLRLCFAGGGLRPAVLPAFAHLDRPAAPDPPAAVVSLWDSRSTGVELPELPWRQRDLDARWEPRGYSDERLRTTQDPTCGVLMMFGSESRQGLFWSPSLAEIPWYDHAAPLRAVLHWALTTPGRHLVHGGAVAGPAGALLLVGKGGQGKSTTAVRCLEAGFDYLGDDYVLLDAREAPTVHSLYGTAKLTAETVERIPSLANAVVNPGAGDEEKAVVDISGARPERMRLSAPVCGIVAPSLSAVPKSALRPLAPMEALRALAPSTIRQLPHEASGALTTMADLARQVPSYALELGRDDARVPDLLAELVA